MEREPGPAYASGVVGETLRRRPAWRRLPNWLQRFAVVGALPSDSEEARLRKSVLVLSSSLMRRWRFCGLGPTRR